MIDILLYPFKYNIEDVVDLYKDADWWENDFTSDFIPTVIKESYCFVGVFKNNKMIGMGRALSDSCSDAYIQDITILKKYRGKGLGIQVTDFIINHLKKNDIDWIALIGAPDTQKFYEKLGFKVMPNYTPMKLEL